MTETYRGFTIEKLNSFGIQIFGVFTKNDQGIGTAYTIEKAQELVNDYLNQMEVDSK